MLTFTAIDFEMANSERVSVCSMGLCRVEDGKIVLSKEFLIKPPKGHDLFFQDQYHVGLHGITKETVKDSPDFGELWENVRPYIAGTYVVAHNLKRIDGSALNQLSETYGLKADGKTFHLNYGEWENCLCTLHLFKIVKEHNPDRFKAVQKQGLADLAKVCGIPFSEGSHHGAGYDAEVTAKCLIALSEQYGIDCVEKWRSISINPKRFADFSVGSVPKPIVTNRTLFPVSEPAKNSLSIDDRLRQIGINGVAGIPNFCRNNYKIHPFVFGLLVNEDFVTEFETSEHSDSELAPMLEIQKSYLAGLNFDIRSICFKGMADALINIVDKRARKRLCTPKQLRILAQYRVNNAANMTIGEASKKIDSLFTK